MNIRIDNINTNHMITFTRIQILEQFFDNEDIIKYLTNDYTLHLKFSYRSNNISILLKSDQKEYGYNKVYSFININVSEFKDSVL